MIGRSNPACVVKLSIAALATKLLKYQTKSPCGGLQEILEDFGKLETFNRRADSALRDFGQV